MKKIYLILFLCLLWTNAWALTVSEVKPFVKKIALITYKEYGKLVSDCGRVIVLKEDEEDYTLDKMYSYVVIFTFRNTLETIRINKIVSITEIPRRRKMDKGFVIAYELTADTTTKNIEEENTPIKFKSLSSAKRFLKRYPIGCVFQLMIIGTKETTKFKT